jgi:serine protease Do
MRYLQIALAGMVGLVAVIPSAQGQTVRVPVTSGGRVSFLGVGLQEINSERAKQLKLPEEAGVEITYVEANSPAAAAGLKTGDVVLQYNGQRVEGAEQFTRMVQETPEGREVKLQVFRNGASQVVTVKIGSKTTTLPAQLSARGALVFPTEPPRAVGPALGPFGFLSERIPALGIQIEAIDGQLADYFSVKAGVLVRSVAKGSAAEKGGIKAGDVITRVGEDKIATPGDLIARTRRGPSLSVVLTRDHKEMTVMVTLDGGDKY